MDAVGNAEDAGEVRDAGGDEAADAGAGGVQRAEVGRAVVGGGHGRRRRGIVGSSQDLTPSSSQFILAA